MLLIYTNIIYYKEIIMQKIYIAGMPMMGKNIVWKLLDGHPSIIANHMHVTMGTFLLQKELIQYLNKRTSYMRLVESRENNKLIIQYKNKKEYSITIGEFFNLLYRFNGYQNLYETSLNGYVIVNNKELENEYYKFNFDIHKFESLIYKNLFYKKKLKLKVEEIIGKLQEIYCKCRNKKINKSKLFIESLHNGLEPLNNVINNLNNIKIICMTRDPLEQNYSSLIRNLNPREKNITYSKYLYSIVRQYIYFEKKFKPYLNFINKNKNNKNVFFMNTNEMIINTEETMKKLAIFLKVDYKKTMAVPSIDKKIMNQNAHPIIGKVNDQASDIFKKNDLKLLRKIYSERNNSSFFIFNLGIYLMLLFLLIKSFLKKRF